MIPFEYVPLHAGHAGSGTTWEATVERLLERIILMHLIMKQRGLGKKAVVLIKQKHRSRSDETFEMEKMCNVRIT